MILILDTVKCAHSNIKYLGLFYIGIFLLSFSRPFAGLQAYFKSFGTFQNNICLQFEVRFFKVGVNSEVSQNSREDDLQLQHGVFTTYNKPYSEKNSKTHSDKKPF